MTALLPERLPSPASFTDGAGATCSVEGCGKGGHLRRGYCGSHYGSLWLKGEGAKACALEDCKTKGKTSRGYCLLHYERWRKYGDPETERLRTFPYGNDAMCSVEGCERKDKISRGYCKAHYARLFRSGDPSPGEPIRVYPKDPTCSVDGCSATYLAKGYCGVHYDRLRRRGTVETSSQLTRYVYVIREVEGEYVKVGLASNPQRRLAEVQVGNPRPLELLYISQLLSSAEAFALETQLHRQHAPFGATGEWFHACVLRTFANWDAFVPWENELA